MTNITPWTILSDGRRHGAVARPAELELQPTGYSDQLDPIDPDRFDRPIASLCIETGEDREELPLHWHK
ncbi:hypothetical protein CK489_38555 [Bradyrhizobium sp. UFLA03-84]|nr:hypothetical protein CK489_38555 [Bradyrhizobium sp. UFLA03-84]